jgi:hypothetical protein
MVLDDEDLRDLCAVVRTWFVGQSGRFGWHIWVTGR